MDSVKTFLSERIENIRTIITTRSVKESESEDPHAFGLLIEHLCLKNAYRIIIFSVISFIAGLICAIFGEHSFLGVTGSVVIMASSVIFFWLMCRTSFEEYPNYSLIRIFTYIYWAAVSLGSVLVSVSEQNEGKTPYFFLIYIATVIAVPVVKLYESAFFGAVILIYGISFGASTEKGVLYFISVFAVTAAYMWLSSVVRCCYSSLWLGRRRLDTTEQRCLQIARKDTLTGLLNKTGLSAKFSDLLQNKHNGEKISVVLIDIDNFRFFNHMYGYDKSDECLYRVCNCIRIVSKPYTELVSRFGGDEFVLVFEDLDEVETVKIAEQLRQSIETMAQPFGNGIVTVSVGVSGTKTLVGKITYSELLNEADEQLMIAKSSGRNCIGFKGRPFIHENRRPAVTGQ